MRTMRVRVLFYMALIHKLLGPLMCLAYILTYHLWVFIQPGTGRPLVDWCSAVYNNVYTNETQHKFDFTFVP